MPTKPPSLSRDTPSLGPGDPTELLGPVMQSSYPDPLTLSQFTTPNKSMLEGGRRTLPESSTKPISLREATVEFDRAVEVARLRQGLMDTTNEWRVRCTLLEEKLKGKGKEVQQLEDEVESLKLETTTLKQQVEALTRSRLTVEAEAEESGQRVLDLKAQLMMAKDDATKEKLMNESITRKWETAERKLAQLEERERTAALHKTLEAKQREEYITSLVQQLGQAKTALQGNGNERERELITLQNQTAELMREKKQLHEELAAKSEEVFTCQREKMLLRDELSRAQIREKNIQMGQEEHLRVTEQLMISQRENRLLKEELRQREELFKSTFPEYQKLAIEAQTLKSSLHEAKSQHEALLKEGQKEQQRRREVEEELMKWKVELPAMIKLAIERDRSRKEPKDKDRSGEVEDSDNESWDDVDEWTVREVMHLGKGDLRRLLSRKNLDLVALKEKMVRLIELVEKLQEAEQSRNRPRDKDAAQEDRDQEQEGNDEERGAEGQGEESKTRQGETADKLKEKLHMMQAHLLAMASEIDNNRSVMLDMRLAILGQRHGQALIEALERKAEEYANQVMEGTESRIEGEGDRQDEGESAFNHFDRKRHLQKGDIAMAFVHHHADQIAALAMHRFFQRWRLHAHARAIYDAFAMMANTSIGREENKRGIQNSSRKKVSPSIPCTAMSGQRRNDQRSPSKSGHSHLNNEQHLHCRRAPEADLDSTTLSYYVGYTERTVDPRGSAKRGNPLNALVRNEESDDENGAKEEHGYDPVRSFEQLADELGAKYDVLNTNTNNTNDDNKDSQDSTKADDIKISGDQGMASVLDLEQEQSAISNIKGTEDSNITRQVKSQGGRKVGKGNSLECTSDRIHHRQKRPNSDHQLRPTGRSRAPITSNNLPIATAEDALPHRRSILSLVDQVNEAIAKSAINMAELEQSRARAAPSVMRTIPSSSAVSTSNGGRYRPVSTSALFRSTVACKPGSSNPPSRTVTPVIRPSLPAKPSFHPQSPCLSGVPIYTPSTPNSAAQSESTGEASSIIPSTPTQSLSAAPSLMPGMDFHDQNQGTMENPHFHRQHDDTESPVPFASLLEESQEEKDRLERIHKMIATASQLVDRGTSPSKQHFQSSETPMTRGLKNGVATTSMLNSAERTIDGGERGGSHENWGQPSGRGKPPKPPSQRRASIPGSPLTSTVLTTESGNNGATSPLTTSRTNRRPSINPYRGKTNR